MKFYKCDICGKIVAMVKATDVDTVCCGKPMRELVPGTTDGAAEKHVPVYTVSGNTVTVKAASKGPREAEAAKERSILYPKCGNGRDVDPALVFRADGAIPVFTLRVKWASRGKKEASFLVYYELQHKKDNKESIPLAALWP